MRTWMPRIVVLLGGGLLALQVTAQSSSYLTLTAEVSTDGEVTLNWLTHANDTGYFLFRRRGDPHASYIRQWPFTGWTTLTNNAVPPLNTFTDPEPLAEGEVYEYNLIRSSTSSSLNSTRAIIAVGRRVCPEAVKGRVVVVVESGAMQEAGSRIARFERDLMLDGWPPTRVMVTADESVVSVRDKIKAIYDADPEQVKAVVLLGRVPIPYSGSVATDGHSSHQGAWPADTYYGAMVTTVWTDTTVNTGTGRYRNVPGDGRFDQNEVFVEMPVGRIDMRDMTLFEAIGDEYELLRRYLDRNHDYRRGGPDLSGARCFQGRVG